MKTAIAFAIAALVPAVVLAAGPSNPADRYDYNMRSTNKDGYVPDPAKANDKFDPYTQGANTSTASSLTDDKSTDKATTQKGSKKSHSHKKAPATSMDK